MDERHGGARHDLLACVVLKIALYVVFLASDDAAMIHVITVYVDGGSPARLSGC